MTTYYVGSGGNDANNGLTWALRKLTLNGAEDIPVAAGDTVYVGAGIYRELLTCDVAGANGNPITYIGDTDGSHTDLAGGMVRVTGSDNDQAASRDHCVTGSVNYRAFSGFVLDGATYYQFEAPDPDNWTISKCAIIGPYSSDYAALYLGGGANHLVQDCLIYGHVLVFHWAQVSDRNTTFERCVITAGAKGLNVSQVGGITVRNCLILGQGAYGVAVDNLISGQTVTVNNCIITNCATGLWALTEGEIIEDYNALAGCATARYRVAVGDHSNSYLWLPDLRWWFELVSGKGRMLSPFDLASYSQLINVAGTSPPSTDARGTAVIGDQREWGPLEYDSSLDIAGGSVGAVSISPGRGDLG